MRTLPTIDLSPAAAPMDRRGFISTSALGVLAAALAAACGGDSLTGPNGGGGGPAPAGVTMSSNVITAPLSAVPELETPGGYRIITTIGGAQANVIILNAAGTYHAFTAICTHENCIVDRFNGQRIICACHGSEFDTAGRNVAGPAPRPLTEYRTSFDATARVVTVTRA